MPRKPMRQPRPSSSNNRHTGPQSRTTRPLQSPPRSLRKFYQCISCGAPADPMFGTGDGSWCPACHQPDTIGWAEGRLPDPHLYGQWFLEQQEKAKPPTMNPDLPASAPPSSFSHRSSLIGATDMKLRKTHSGTYCCPDCCIEYELTGESVLKCEDCGGPLYQGTLEDVGDSEANPE